MVESVLLDDADIALRARHVAGALRALGLAPGAPVAVLAGNSPDFVVARDAATALDLQFVPVNPRLASPEIADLITRSDARLLVADRAVAPVAAGVRVTTVAELAQLGAAAPGPARAPDAIGATLLFTSGTTGRPKGCGRGAAEEGARAAELTATYRLTAADVHLVACPLAHSAPGMFLRACRAVGASTVLLPRFDPAALLAAVARHRATIVFLVPTQVGRLLALPEGELAAADLASLRAVIVAGAPFPVPLRERLRARLGPGRLWEFYGSSETGSITVLPPEEPPGESGCVGRAPPGVELRLLDEDHRDVPPGAVGEVFVRSPAVMRGYLGEPTERVDGFLSVGDLARLDAAGRLVLVDRKGDVVISGGVNVYPAEVERALAEHPAVAGAVVCGVPDDDWGERVAAAVSPRGGAELDPVEVREFLRGRLAGFKIPKQIVVVAVEELPVGPSGKPLRRAARALLSARTWRA